MEDANSNQRGLLKNDYVQDGIASALARKRDKMSETLKDKVSDKTDSLGRPEGEK